MATIDLTPASKNLAALIAAVPDDTLGGPTPCSDYCVAALLDHIAGLTVAFGGAARKESGVSATMGPQGDASNLAPDWRTSLPRRLDALAEAWKDEAAWTGTTRVGGQEIPGEVAGIIAFGELTVHGWDLARGTGLPFEADQDGLERLFDLVSQTFGPEHDEARGTAVGPAVAVDEDASLLDKTLGLLGRRPQWSA